MKHIQHISLMVGMILAGFTANAEEIPSEVSRLQLLHKAKIDEINRTYIKELEILKIKYTKQGDLDSANLTVAIITNLKGERVDNASVLDGAWMSFNLGSPNKYLRAFQGDVMVDHQGTKHPVSIENGFVTIGWGATRFEKLKFDPKQPNILHGSTDSGRKITYARVD